MQTINWEEITLLPNAKLEEGQAVTVMVYGFEPMQDGYMLHVTGENYTVHFARSVPEIHKARKEHVLEMVNHLHNDGVDMTFIATLNGERDVKQLFPALVDVFNEHQHDYQDVLASRSMPLCAECATSACEHTETLYGRKAA